MTLILQQKMPKNSQKLTEPISYSYYFRGGAQIQNFYEGLQHGYHNIFWENDEQENENGRLYSKMTEL